MIPRARSPHASSAVVSEWAPALGTACAALIGIAITELMGEGTEPLLARVGYILLRQSDELAAKLFRHILVLGPQSCK